MWSQPCNYVSTAKRMMGNHPFVNVENWLNPTSAKTTHKNPAARGSAAGFARTRTHARTMMHSHTPELGPSHVQFVLPKAFLPPAQEPHETRTSHESPSRNSKVESKSRKHGEGASTEIRVPGQAVSFESKGEWTTPFQLQGCLCVCVTSCI